MGMKLLEPREVTGGVRTPGETPGLAGPGSKGQGGSHHPPACIQPPLARCSLGYNLLRSQGKHITKQSVLEAFLHAVFLHFVSFLYLD